MVIAHHHTRHFMVPVSAIPDMRIWKQFLSNHHINKEWTLMNEWKPDKHNSDGIRTGFSMQQPNTTQYLSCPERFLID